MRISDQGLVGQIITPDLGRLSVFIDGHEGEDTADSVLALILIHIFYKNVHFDFHRGVAHMDHPGDQFCQATGGDRFFEIDSVRADGDQCRLCCLIRWN